MKINNHNIFHQIANPNKEVIFNKKTKEILVQWKESIQRQTPGENNNL